MACSDKLQVLEPDDSQLKEALVLHAEDYCAFYHHEQTSVSIEDIELYANQNLKNFSSTKSEKSEFVIQPLSDKDNDTLLYVIKYHKGWDVIASDKRVQPLLASDSESDFDEVMKTEGPGKWLEIIASEMKIVKHLPDEDLKLPKEEQEYNIMFWQSISNIDEFIAQIHPQTKAIIPPSTGHYELVNTYFQEVEADSLNHLLTTFWTQNDPYNKYCPLKSNSLMERAPAGCVAIAGAQVLYYFHYMLNIPQMAPSQAYCNSHVGDSPLDWGQSNYSSTIWNSMASNGENAAPLIANIGNLVNMDYDDNESRADLEDLCEIAFPAYGLTCFQDEYNETRVEDCLRQSQPVVIGAFGTVNHFLGIPYYSDGHVFIIDGYKKYKTKTTKVYRWIWDDANQGVMHPEVDDEVVVTYSSPYMRYFKMNWGGATSANNTWYTLTGNWHVNEYDFDYEREMLWNFRHSL